jgi:hypothetical protein
MARQHLRCFSRRSNGGRRQTVQGCYTSNSTNAGGSAADEAGWLNRRVVGGGGLAWVGGGIGKNRQESAGTQCIAKSM